jgi:para-nitrobenzyl esterase
VSSSRQAVVTTKNGKLEGAFAGGIYTFKGIPYAAPPVGDLRWLPPRPVKPWDGLRPAQKYGAIAPQNPMPVPLPGMPPADEAQDEDCLFLNVWTPGLDDAKRPVMFWIHGGAFIIGSGTEAFLVGGSLARRGDIVLVSLNYRMGVFGFMNLKEITGGQIPATGNEGLLDQVAALEWVRENISAFGGDPANVTAFGFSAGGMSIGNLLGMPAARGKFHKAIHRSGAANIIGPLEEAVSITGQFLEILNIKGKDTDSLRKLTTQQLLDAQQALGLKLQQTEFRLTPFQPVKDGAIIPDWPLSAVRKGLAENMPVIVGNTADELKISTAMTPGIAKLTDDALCQRLDTMLPHELVPGLVRDYRAISLAHGGSGAPAEILANINTDLTFKMPALRLVAARRDSGAPAYHYLFTYKSPAMGGMLGAMHGLDNPFLFGALDKEFTGDGPEQESLAIKIQDSCAAFARTGDPSCRSIGNWPVYGNDRVTMILDTETRLEKNVLAGELKAWEKFDFLSTRPL